MAESQWFMSLVTGDWFRLFFGDREIIGFNAQSTAKVISGRIGDVIVVSQVKLSPQGRGIQLVHFTKYGR